MEKKTLILPIMILLVLILASCSGTSGGPIEPNSENMIISFENNAHFDFYGIQVEILNQAPTSVNADGSKIGKGDSHTFEFLAEDFELAGKATMKVSLLSNNVNSVRIDREIPLELQKNKQLFFEITGDSIKTADIKRVN